MTEHSSSSAIADAFRRKYQALQSKVGSDPLLNSVRRFASDTFRALESGSLAISDVAQAVDDLDVEAFTMRAKEFHRRKDPDASGLNDPFKSLRDLPFDEFRRKVEQANTGFVFTAHPTFALGVEKRELIATYPKGGDETALQEWKEKARGLKQVRPKKITLRYEHDQARIAIQNAQNAIRALNRKFLNYARENYPDQWQSLRPNPISLASWVGYDLDGRTDIHWGESIRIRLEEKAAQLDRYEKTLAAILEAGPSAPIESLRQTIADARDLAARHADAFAGDLSDPTVVVNAANMLTRNDPGRLVSLTGVVTTLTKIIAEESNGDRKVELCLLRAEMLACGLGVARIHLRINALQVRSALRVDLGLSPESDFKGRLALDVASQKVRGAEHRSINFGSVFLEQMTARRQFMLCAQILKHIDADTPIRFLIAECEAPATVMGAIYLARLYGVDKKLDISPLFETPQAMESGGRFIERLLDEPEYCDYIRARGRMAIQIGFSDSGRFIGQCAASLAIERLQVLFARALAKADVRDVEALIFNTHGESMGRGAHPGAFRQRMDHLTPPWVRSMFLKEGIRLSCECSFQGGEGYLHFQTPALSQTTVDMLWEHSAETPPDAYDHFYDDINFSWDFYRGLRTWQEELYEREDYRAVLFAFPQNLLYKTGSRETKRPQQNGAAPEIRAMRAIPHNAILQQMAMPVNVSGGIGTASGREIDRFIDHVAASPRMRELMTMAVRARSLTGVSILRAYASVYSPTYWSTLAGIARNTDKVEVYEMVVQALLKNDTGLAIDRLADYLARDLRYMDVMCGMLGDIAEGAQANGAGVELGVLHALRQALIAQAVYLVAGAPDFSRRHDLDKTDLVEMALHMRLAEVSDWLKVIFPKETPAENLISGLVEHVDEHDQHGGAYPEIHERIIEPLEEITTILRTISLAISNHYGAYG